MFSSLKSTTNSGKDAAVAFTVKKLINIKAKKLGVHIEELVINSSDKYIITTFFLKNDEAPLTIKVLNYAITTKNGKHFLEVEELQKSREWNNSYVDRKRYKIPPEVVKAAELIL